MQNKANLLKAEMGVSIYMKGIYEEITRFLAARKQSQFKANLKRNTGFLPLAQEIATALRTSQ